MPNPIRLPLTALALACALALLAACAPALGRQSDGSVAVRAERAGDGWYAAVPAADTGRALVIRRAWATDVHVPRGFVPPPGTCRLWRPELPPARQAPFGPCPSGEPDVPAGAYLIAG